MSDHKPVTQRQYDVLRTLSEGHDIEVDLDGRLTQNEQTVSIVLVENLIRAGLIDKQIGQIASITQHDLTSIAWTVISQERPKTNPRRAKRHPAQQVYLGDRTTAADRLARLIAKAHTLGYPNYHQLIAAIADGDVKLSKK
jgi:hypothetical protein